MSQNTPSDSNKHSILEDLLSLPQIERAMPSPDGQWAAWTWAGLGPTSDVYAARTDGTNAPIQLTATAENTHLVSWSPNSQSIVIAQDEGGNERFQLFRVELSQPGDLQPLTETQPNFFLRGGALHPNGKWLIYGANVDEDGHEIEATWLYRHNLESGERVPIAKPPTAMRGDMLPSLNRQGTHILYMRNDRHPSGVQVWIVGVDGSNHHEIMNVGDSRKAYGRWCADGERVLVYAETETHYRVGVWSLADESLRWLMDDVGRNIENVYQPLNSEHAVVVDVRNTRFYASWLDIETGEERPIPAAQHTMIPLAPAGNNTWTTLTYSSQQVSDLVSWSPEGGETTSLTHVWERTRLKPDDLVAGEDFRWKADDGLEIQGWLYRTCEEPKGTIIYVHGGPTWHYEDSIDVQVQFFAMQGFHVLVPNYRGSTGFSRAYREAIKADGWGGREQDDIRAGIEALIAAGIAQPGKIGVTGTSYGGYSSWWAITHYSTDLVAAAAPICGMTDLVADYETTRPDLRPYSVEMMGGTPAEVPERYRERSPIHYVGSIRGRLLIVQGEQDPNVTPENVRLVRAALEKAGIAYELLTFPDEGHGIVRLPNQKRLLLKMAEFFESAFAK